MLFKMPKHLGEKYSPLYFLASVGAGGLVITFFMYLMFWVPHSGRPVPIFEDIQAFFTTTNTIGQAMVVLAMAGIAFFAYQNLRLLFWNLGEFAAFRKLDIYKSHQTSNAQTQVKAQALALAMTVNVLFIVGLVFVPNLWSVVEYLFPAAMIAFAAIGYLAFKNIGHFLGRVLVEGGFCCKSNNSFAQLLPAFAFAMIGVGLSAPAAMSTVPLTVGISLILSTFFYVAAVILAGVALILGFRAMLEFGAAKEASPTLMIVIPIVTVLSILTLRQDHGLHVVFEGHTSTAETFMFLASMLSIQVLFAMLGIMVLRRQNYFASFINGAGKSAGSYALVCPGVALSVMLHFFVNKGLVATDLIDKFSVAYWVITGIAIASQFLMIWLVMKLNAKHFSADAGAQMVAAE